MKKLILIFNLLAAVVGINAQDHTNDTQATILKTGDYTVTIYAKPMTDIVNAPDINLNFAVSLPGTSGPGPMSAATAIGGTLTAAPIEIFGARRCYPYTLSSAGINMTGGMDNPIATVIFPSSIGVQVLAQLNDYTGSGAQQAYWYISHSGGDQTPYASLFYGTNATNVESGDSYVDINEPLPLNLVAFNASKSGEKDAYLTWTTANEENTSRFIVQRSFDRKSWIEIGAVGAAGHSIDIRNYELYDPNVNSGRTNRLQVYYRLKMLDLDGKSSLSPIQSVVFNNGTTTKANEFLVYPNPASDGVQIEWGSDNLDQPTSLEFYDVAGKLIHVQKVSDKTYQEYVDFAHTNIQAGLYLLRIMNGTEPIEHKQIVVGQNR
jgi:hypothetical protein